MSRWNHFSQEELDAIKDGLLGEAELPDEELQYRVEVASTLLDDIYAWESGQVSW